MSILAETKREVVVEVRPGQPIETAIGYAVRDEMNRQGITTTELANRVGISQAQISRLESGKQGFRSATLSKIGQALQVDPVFFYIDETKRNAPSYGSLVSKGVAEAMRSPEFVSCMETMAKAWRERRGEFRAVARVMGMALGQ